MNNVNLPGGKLSGVENLMYLTMYKTESITAVKIKKSDMVSLNNETYKNYILCHY